MGLAPRLSSEEEDDDDEALEPEAPETRAPATGHPYRAPAVRDGDRPRAKRKTSLVTPIVAGAGGVGVLAVMYALSRVPVHAPPEPVAAEAPVYVAPAPSPITVDIRETPAPQSMIEEQAEEMEIAMAFERHDDERIVSMLFPKLGTNSCARLRILASSCGRLRRWPCVHAAQAEFNNDGCQSKGIPYR